MRGFRSRCEKTGLSLTEVLISIFVLMIGLMGVAAMFPVGSHFVEEGDRLDRSSAIAQAASNELVTRGMLDPNRWQRVDTNLTGQPVAIVIDPLGIAEAGLQGGSVDAATVAALSVFPYAATLVSTGSNTPPLLPPLRVSIPDGVQQLMSKPVADLIFRSRDDLTFDLPDRAEDPARQLFDDTRDRNGNLVPLRRQSSGAYTWLATITPLHDAQGGIVLPPHPLWTQMEYNVSIVVFHNRDFVFPISGATKFNEREVRVADTARSVEGGEVVLEARTDAAELDGLRQGDWLMLYGVYGSPNPSHGYPQRAFAAWYQIRSLDVGPGDGTTKQRSVSLTGPEFPFDPSQTHDLRAGIFPGAIAVLTRPMRLERPSAWSIK